MIPGDSDRADSATRTLPLASFSKSVPPSFPFRTATGLSSSANERSARVGENRGLAPVRELRAGREVTGATAIG